MEVYLRSIGGREQDKTKLDLIKDTNFFIGLELAHVEIKEGKMTITVFDEFVKNSRTGMSEKYVRVGYPN